ncbi:MAG: iron-containing alcohol dehydrogenase [Acidimicrobiales bacterium]
MAVEPAHVEQAAAKDVLAEVGDATRYVSAFAQRAGFGGPDAVVTTSLEEQALDALVERERRVDATTVVGVGGGLTLDTAKYVALKCGKDVVLIPTALSSLAPFTTEIARRVRRQVTWLGDISPRVVLDWPLLAQAPPARNRAGAAEVVATLSASWDWRLADTRDKGLPAAPRVLSATEALRARLADAAEEVRAVSTHGLVTLAGLLQELAGLITDVGHRRMVDGSEHTFAQAFEHRLGRLGGGDTGGYGEMVGMGTVAMSALQAWFGLSAGGPIDPQTAVALLSRCGVACNPHQLDVDEGTFRGVLRHTVRFAVGEFLPYSVLNEADVNFTAAEEMWRWCWRVPRIAS